MVVFRVPEGAVSGDSRCVVLEWPGPEVAPPVTVTPDVVGTGGEVVQKDTTMEPTLVGRSVVTKPTLTVTGPSTPFTYTVDKVTTWFSKR